MAGYSSVMQYNHPVIRAHFHHLICIWPVFRLEKKPNCLATFHKKSKTMRATTKVKTVFSFLSSGIKVFMIQRKTPTPTRMIRREKIVMFFAPFTGTMMG
jgi:hypothetical protein